MNKHVATALGAAAFLVAAVATPALAAPVDEPTFVQTVIGINLEEISLGNLAQQKSQNDQVKAYGQMLVKDHTDNNAKATALAQKLGATVPQQPSAAAQQMDAHLQTLSGPAFDTQFLNYMAKGHATAIAMFQEQAGGSTDVASFAKATLPALQMHLAKAQALQQSVPKS